MKRFFLAIGSLGLVALLGITMLGHTAGAQNGTPASASTQVSSKEDTFLTTLAGKLGVSTDSLQSAITQTTDELGYGPGRFGERIRERIHDRIDNHRDRVIERRDLSQAAAFLGITEDQLKTELQNGEGFISVAREHGKTDDQIRTFLIDRASTAIDERLQAASDDATAPAGA